MLLAKDMKALKKALKELLYEESRLLYQRVGGIAIWSSIVDVESFEGGLKLPYWWPDIVVNQRKFDLRIIELLGVVHFAELQRELLPSW